MPLSRQEVANQLNQLQASGATEQQIVDAVNAAGYKPDDFNVDLSGSFRPLTIGQGKQAGVDYIKPTAAETAESNQFYDNLASSASVAKKPTSGTVRTTTISETQTFQQSTGGGTSTVYSTPATDTAASLSYKQEAKTASDLQSSYALNPDSKFGKSALDRRLADGRITQEQYNDIVNSTPEQRREKSLEYNRQYEEARSKEIAAQEGGQPVVVVTTEPNSSEVTTTYNKTVTTEVTKLDGDVPGSPNIRTETIDGVEYQVVDNNDGTNSYTPTNSPFGEDDTITEDNVEPLQEPPGTQDEFSGIDAQVEANENALQEPPQLSDEEVNTYFDNVQNEQIESENTVVDDGSDPYVSNGESTVSESSFSPNPGSSQGSAVRGLTAAAQAKATKDDAVSFQKKPDWRVRLSLSPGANYLYKVGDGQAGILNPLQKTDGVIFPYTPAVSVTYTAGYDSADIVHSNYKVFQYKGSSVDNVQITGDFTAQDTNEANYLLAVIHFFRSVTKMFYGQDQNPKNGVPPPLLYLSGLGTYQYDAHPLAITNFTYSLPTDVDYIRAGSQTNQPGQNLAGQQTPVNTNSLQQLRTVLNKLKPSSPVWSNQQSLINSEATYVPTKMQIQLTAIPIVTRNDISNNFSLAKYGTGELLRGTKRSGGGIW